MNTFVFEEFIENGINLGQDMFGNVQWEDVNFLDDTHCHLSVQVRN